MIIFKRGLAASQYLGYNQTYIIQHRRTYIGKLSYQFPQNMLRIKCSKQHPLSINKICRRLADVWSHPSHYPVHPPTPPWSHSSISWSWMDDSRPFISMSIGRPIPEIKLFQTLTLKFQLQGQAHGCGQRATIPEIELFRNWTLKYPRSRSWVRSKVNVTYCTQYPTDALPFRFTSIGPTIPEIWPK